MQKMGFQMTKPREPFFKPEDIGNECLEPIANIDVIRITNKCNRLVEPLREELEELRCDVAFDPRVRELCDKNVKLLEENERLRAELAQMKSIADVALTAVSDLEEEIDQAPVVYGAKYSDTDDAREGWSLSRHWTSHKARLVRIEAITSIGEGEEK